MLIAQVALVPLRRGFAAAACAVLAVLPAAQSQAQSAASYPNKPVRIVVGFPAGGASDLAARIVAERMSSEWGSPVYIENRVGAGGTIGDAFVAAAAPDGYTLLLIAPGTHAVSSAMYSNLPYDPVKSFASITQVAWGPYLVVVNASSPVKTLKELVDRARAAPGEVSYASTGKGSGSHFVAESLAQATGTQLLHVPYNGAAPATLAVLSGQVSFAVTDMSAVPYLQSGKLRALAVTTPKRSSQLPDVPTVGEAGVPQAEYTLSVGFVGPAGTPPDIVRKINATVVHALQNDDVKRRLETLGLEAEATPADVFEKKIASDVVKFADFVEKTGLKAK